MTTTDRPRGPALSGRIQFLEDRDGYRYELRYISDKEGREVDFAITKDGIVEMLVEAKWSEDKVSAPLRYFSERLRPARAVQIVGHLRRDKSSGAS